MPVLLPLAVSLQRERLTLRMSSVDCLRLVVGQCIDRNFLLQQALRQRIDGQALHDMRQHLHDDHEIGVLVEVEDFTMHAKSPVYLYGDSLSRCGAWPERLDHAGRAMRRSG